MEQLHYVEGHALALLDPIPVASVLLFLTRFVAQMARLIPTTVKQDVSVFLLTVKGNVPALTKNQKFPWKNVFAMKYLNLFAGEMEKLIQTDVKLDVMEPDVSARDHALVRMMNMTVTKEKKLCLGRSLIQVLALRFYHVIHMIN